MKYFINILIIFFIGGIGGFLLSDVVVPRLSETSYFSGIGWLQDIKNKTVIVNKTEKIYVSESENIQSVLEKNRKMIVLVKTFQGERLLSSGTGFIVSSDGLVLTRTEVVPNKENKISVTIGEETFPSEFLKKSDEYGIVLLKTQALNFPSVVFSGDPVFSLGGRVMLFGKKQTSKGAIDFINTGIVKSAYDMILETDIFEDSALASGAPIFNSSGDVAGICFVNSKGNVLAISSEAIKKFIY